MAPRNGRIRNADGAVPTTDDDFGVGEIATEGPTALSPLKSCFRSHELSDALSSQR